MVTPAAVRAAVAHVLREHDVSERRAFSIVAPSVCCRTRITRPPYPDQDDTAHSILCERLCTLSIMLDFSRPGKPTDNAFIEAFNGRLRSECLNAHWFLSLADAREKMEAWLKDYNEDRPHGAIGHRPPILLQNLSGATSPPP